MLLFFFLSFFVLYFFTRGAVLANGTFNDWGGLERVLRTVLLGRHCLAFYLFVMSPYTVDGNLNENAQIYVIYYTLELYSDGKIVPSRLSHRRD